MKSRVHVLISGHVQGVFFRATAEEEAERIGITGWVRNTSEGRVEAIFEGEKDAVEQMVEWCRHGPPRAVVRNVDVEWEKFRDEFDGFRVLR